MTLLISEPPLQVLPSLAKKIGLNEAIVLQQLHYWLDPKRNKNLHENLHWVYNTYEQWQKQFPFFSKKTIRRIIGRLEGLGLIKSIAKYGFQKTKFYTIDYDKLHILDVLSPGQNDQTHLPKEADTPSQIDLCPLPKMTSCIYTETIAEITPHPLELCAQIRAVEKEGEDKEEELRNMLSIWNTIRPDQKLFLTEGRKEALLRFNEEFSQTGVITWKDYCDKIARSRFLMGENATGFKAQLDWALKPENIYKILEGTIYDKPVTAKTEVPRVLALEELESFLQQNFPEGTLVNPWKAILRELVRGIGSLTVQSWFVNMGLIAVDEDEAVLLIDTRFKADWIRNHYSHDLERALQSIYPGVQKFRFERGGQK